MISAKPTTTSEETLMMMEIIPSPAHNSINAEIPVGAVPHQMHVAKTNITPKASKERIRPQQTVTCTHHKEEAP